MAFSSDQDHRLVDNPFASPDGTIFSNGRFVSPYPFGASHNASAGIPTNNSNNNANETYASPPPTVQSQFRGQFTNQQAAYHQQLPYENPFSSTNRAEQTRQTPIMRPTTSPHPLSSAVKFQLHPTGSIGGMSSTPTMTAATVAESPVHSPYQIGGESLVDSARKEWKKHGAALTQDLEETRCRDENRQGTLTVRLISAENRRDVTNRKYTAYLLRVKLPNNQVLELEHRYSEFVKLKHTFENHGVELDVAFPPKHLAGRLGNWQLAKKWAPGQHEELVRYRQVQLDVWLVAVTAKYNIGDMPHSLARAVYEFLTLSDRPPCDMENTLAYSSSAMLYTEGLRTKRNSNNVLRWNNPISFTLGSSIRQACRIVETMCIPSAHSGMTNDQTIPLDLLQCAKGLIFLTVIKAGFMVSGRIGTGLLIARLDGDSEETRWSAPCALGTIGVGWGMLAGGDITHYLVVLTKQEAVETMVSGTVQLGTEVGVAVGPVGRMSQVSASASNTEWTLHPAYSYAHSKGLFMGMSIEGAVLSTRNDVNAKFYGRSGITGIDLVLDGLTPPPKAAEPLYMALNQALAMEIPQDGFRPSQLFQESSTSSNHVVMNGDGYHYNIPNENDGEVFPGSSPMIHHGNNF